MRIYADVLYHRHKKVILGRYKHTVVRIPVLIRIGEFASWLQYNPTKTLIHYIGEHTWFSKRYCQNGCGSVLKELIYRGHALILLDGLDEIPEVRRREEIVRLIEEFIREYVKDPNSISAFDEKLFDNFRPRTHVVETQPPSKSVGNQIIITSRIVGYDMNSLIGTFITHCLLPLMKQDQVNEFAEKWMSQVEQVVHKVLSSVENNIGKQIIERLSQRRIEAVKSIFENGEKCLLFNPSLLTLICASTYQSLNEFRPKSRIEILHHVVESALRFWTKQEPSISKQLLREFLINLSSYLQLKSPSGLIDTFDITRVAHLTLKQRIVTITGAELRQYTKKLLKTLESNAGIVAERGLNVFAFQHLSFQEYFVAQSLVKCDFSDQKITKYYEIEKTANRILSFTINPCFREPLLMALGWISCKWPFDYFDRFCTVLIRSNENYSIPLGALLLFDALNDMQSLPSESVIFTALSCLLDHPSNMIAERYLIPNLFKLSEDIIRKWMSSQFKDDKSLSKFCQCLLMQYDYRFKSRLPGGKYRTSKFSVISKQLDSFYNEGTSAKFVADQTLRTIMMLEGASYNIFFNPWASYFKQKKIDVSTIHPLILPILIVVCGGVIWEPDYGSIKIYWSHRRMYHETSITEPIIEYLTNQKQSHSIKVQTLIEQYETVIKKASPSDTSNDIVDTFNENKEDPSKESPKPTDEVTLLESNYINLCNNWEKLIDMECQRISDVNNIKQNENKDCRLFAASICLARLSQVQYYSPSYDSTTSNTHFSSLGEKVSNAIRNICDPILQIIALDMILEMKDPFIFDEKQRNELDLRMTPLLKDFLPFLPLLTLTFMVVRFHTQQKDFPISLMIKMIGKRLRETLIDRDSPSREAVLIVLKELGHSDDLPKSFDPTEWNLSLLFRCFTNGTSFGSLNTTFLSLIYMTELAFDTHLLQMYIDGDYKDKIFYLERLISQGNDSSNNDKIMTYEAAKWITNYLQKPQNKDVLHEVITIMFECLTVEEKALAVIEQWIVYRNEKNLRIFAQYAALQLFIERSNLSHLIDIINEIFSNDDGLHFNSLIEHIVNSRVDDFTILRQILTRCQTNLCYSSHISIWLSNEKIFDSILNLELERVTQNEDKPSRLPLKSLLFIINGCSYDLQVKLKQHLQTFIEQIGEKDNIVEEQYVANVIKWIIE
ncbi:unnamed protein product, partial [Rotaria sp. Silwood2]